MAVKLEFQQHIQLETSCSHLEDFSEDFSAVRIETAIVIPIGGYLKTLQEISSDTKAPLTPPEYFPKIE